MSFLLGYAGDFYRKKEGDIEGILLYHGMSGYGVPISTRVVTREQLLVPIGDEEFFIYHPEGVRLKDLRFFTAFRMTT